MRRGGDRLGSGGTCAGAAGASDPEQQGLRGNPRPAIARATVCTHSTLTLTLTPTPNPNPDPTPTLTCQVGVQDRRASAHPDGAWSLSRQAEHGDRDQRGVAGRAQRL